MNKEAKDCLTDKMFPVRLPVTEVDAFTDGFYKVQKSKFVYDNVVIIRLNVNTKNSIQVVYYDDVAKVERAIVVPPNFMFKTPDDPVAKTLLDKYREYMIKNLSGQLAYQGDKIGSDPEIFCENENGEIIPAFSFLGSKEKPNRGPNVAYGSNAVYWDGFQAEFDTTAISCMGWHADSIRNGLKGLYDLMVKHNPKAVLSSKTVFDIPMELLKTSKKEHVAFGCNPSLNAYDMKGMEAPGEEVLYRTAGGHIHFGLPPAMKTKESAIKIVKALDAVLGVAGVSCFAEFDDPRRRQMYGLAGEFRLPPHGIEYRTLSNAWLFHPLIANLVFDLARSTTTFGYKDFMKYWNCEEAETIRIINECDVSQARVVLDKNKTLLTRIINTRYNNEELVSFVYDILRNGMESAIKTPHDIASNWLLKPGQNWVTHCAAPGKNVSLASSAMDKVP